MKRLKDRRADPYLSQLPYFQASIQANTLACKPNASGNFESSKRQRPCSPAGRRRRSIPSFINDRKGPIPAPGPNARGSKGGQPCLAVSGTQRAGRQSLWNAVLLRLMRCFRPWLTKAPTPISERPEPACWGHSRRRLIARFELFYLVSRRTLPAQKPNHEPDRRSREVAARRDARKHIHRNVSTMARQGLVECWHQRLDAIAAQMPDWEQVHRQPEPLESSFLARSHA